MTCKRDNLPIRREDISIRRDIVSTRREDIPIRRDIVSITGGRECHGKNIMNRHPYGLDAKRAV
jgi:hypothetical protein